jgi:non-specific serine/threonine protein kinase/serine/threonine-protein kinase
MGVVYQARHLGLKRLVALKMILSGSHAGSSEAQRFIAEGEAIAALQHPNVVQVYDFGHHDGLAYMALEYVNGGSLNTRLREDPLHPRDAAWLVEKLAQGIAAAHAQGIIHRDLKPHNVLLIAPDDSNPSQVAITKCVPKVTDFGLAKRVEGGSDLTQTGMVLGTPSYMSPEMAAGNSKVGQPADVYALGAILYECLAGRPPFRGPTPLETVKQVVANDPVAVRQLQPKCPPDLETICMKCLEKAPEKRYGSATQLADDLRRFLSDEPILARPVSSAERLLRWCRRNPRVALLVSTVALLLVLVASGSMAAAYIISKEQGETLRQKEIAEQSERAALVAAEAEKKAKENALSREAQTKAVMNFVEKRVFAAARPEGQEGGLGREVTLRKAIESALPYVGKAFPNQPLIEARLRLTLGQSFYLLGDARTAAEQQETARALYTRHRGPDHPDTLDSMTRLATSYAALGRQVEALKLKEQTLALHKAKLGPDDPATLWSMNNLANSYGDVGRHAEAIKLHKETLALRKAKLGPDDPDTLWSMFNLACSYVEVGRHAEALKLFEHTLAVHKAKLGPDHPDTLMSMYNVAECYAALGRQIEALKLREQTLALRKAKLGPDHPETLWSMNSLAASYAVVGRQAEALKLLQETLALRKAKLGPDDPDTLKSMGNLAATYTYFGRHAEALKLLQETLTLQKAKLGPDDPDTLKSMNNLAISYAAVGRQAESLKLREKTLALRKAKLGPDHADTLSSMDNLSNSYAVLGRDAEALKLREETLALRKAKLGADHLDTLRSIDNLADSYSNIGRHAEALKVREEALTLRKAKLGPDHPETLTSIYNVACSHALMIPKASNRAKEAELAMEWLRSAVAAGYHDVAQMKKDKDLDSLRTREDFKKLLAELEQAKQAPKNKVGK